MPGNELGTATLALETDATKYDKGLKEAEDKAEKFGSSASKAASKAGDGLDEAGGKASGLSTKLGGVASVAGGFIVAQGITGMAGYLGEAAKAAAEDEQATARLDQTLRNLGGNFDANKAKIDNAISAGEKLAFTDDDVRDSFEFLANATGDVDEALQRQKIAMDLARGAHIPLATATKMVGKVNEENIEGFKKLGITIGDNATEADALAAVQAKFAGQSEAYASSTAGQFEVAQIRMAEAQETIGTALLPAMTGLATIASTVLPVAFQLLGTAIGGISSAIGFVTDNFTLLLPVIIPIAAVIGVALVAALAVAIPMVYAYAAGWVAAAAGVIAANAPLIILIATFMLIVAAIVLVVQHWDEIVAKFPILGTIVDTVKGALDAFVGFITGTFVPGITGGFTAIVDKIQAVWPTIENIIRPVMETVQTLIETAWTTIQGVFEGAFTIIEGLMDVFVGIFTGDWEQVWSGVQSIIEGAWAAIQAIFTGAFESLKAMWEGAFNFFNEITGGKLGEIVGVITDKIGAAADIISGFVHDLWGYVNDVSSALSSMGGYFWDLYNSISGAIGAALGIIQGLIDKIRSIPSPSSIIGKLNPFASGGRNLPEQLGIVGENGPELMYIPQGADIYSTAESARMVKSGLNISMLPQNDNAAGSGVTVAFNGPTEIYARDKEDARRGAGDVGWATMQALKARGA